MGLIRAQRSGFITRLRTIDVGGKRLAQLTEQPRLRQRPLAFDCRRRNASYFRSLFDRKPAEELRFDHSVLLRVERGKFIERVVQRQKIMSAAVNGHIARLCQVELVISAATLGRLSRAGALNQYATHSCS